HPSRPAPGALRHGSRLHERLRPTPPPAAVGVRRTAGNTVFRPAATRSGFANWCVAYPFIVTIISERAILSPARRSGGRPSGHTSIWRENCIDEVEDNIAVDNGPCRLVSRIPG